MNMFRNVRKPIAAALAVVMTLLSAPIIPAQAAIVGTDQIIASPDNARDKVSAFLARGDVRAELERLGLSPEEAKKRVGALSDKEISMIAGKIDSMPAGEGLGAVVGAIVLIFIVLLITDLVGLTNVFGFTKKGSLSPN